MKHKIRRCTSKSPYQESETNPATSHTILYLPF